MPDLPPIPYDVNDSLPESPDPSLTPYRITARPGPGQEGPENVVTGYGPRRPITPPAMAGQGAVGMPDMSNAYIAAYSHLPVDEAAKAMQAANKYIAMRGYQSDLQQGKDAQATWAKWAPMLIGSGTGVPEALKAMDAQRTAQQAPMVYPGGTTYGGRFYPGPKPTTHIGARGQVIQVDPSGQVKVLREPDESTSPETVTESYKIPEVQAQEAVPESKGFLGFGAHPASPAVAGQPERTIKRTVKENPASPGKKLTKEQAKIFLDQVGGDKDKARKLAKAAGYTF